LDFDQISELIDVVPDSGLARQISERGINFRLSAELITTLKDSGGGPATMAALRSFMSNSQPTVVLRLSRTRATPGSRLTLRAEAADPDGDDISYRWLSSVGEIVGDGPTVELDTSGIDMSKGLLLIGVSVTISDRKGGFASDSKTVTVSDESDERAAGAGGSLHSESGSEMSLEATIEGKDILVRIEGGARRSVSQIGSLEVSLSMNNGRIEVNKLIGGLLGVPCRVDFAGLENIVAGSFKEPPGADNQWRRAVVRIRIKDPKRVIRFVIGSKVLNESNTH